MPNSTSAGESGKSIDSLGGTVSVVIPLYNHARYIEAALESVLSQTSPADEIVLIDDGSSDDGYEIASRLLSKVPQAKVVRQANAGANNAINRAIALSVGQYIAVLNSDDVFNESKLERFRALAAANPRIGLIAGGVGIIDAESAKQTTGYAVDWLSRAISFYIKSQLPQLALLNENFVATTSNMVFSRDLWRAAGGFHELRYCHDLDFLMFAYGYGPVMLDLANEHIEYRVHSKNTIGENIARIRVELAAVISQTLFASGSKIFSSTLDEEDFLAFQQFSANKGLSHLVLFFLSIRSAFASRAEFYKYALAPQRAAAFQASVST